MMGKIQPATDFYSLYWFHPTGSDHRGAILEATSALKSVKSAIF